MRNACCKRGQGLERKMKYLRKLVENTGNDSPTQRHKRYKYQKGFINIKKVYILRKKCVQLEETTIPIALLSPSSSTISTRKYSPLSPSN